MDRTLLGCAAPLAAGQKTPSASRTWHGAWIAAWAQRLLPARLPGSHLGTLGACTSLVSPHSGPWPVRAALLFPLESSQRGFRRVRAQLKDSTGNYREPRDSKVPQDPQSPTPGHGRATLDVAPHRATSLTRSRHKATLQLPLSNIQLQKRPALASTSRATSYAAWSARGGVLARLRAHGGQFGSASQAAITALTQQSCLGSKVSFSIATRPCS